MRFTAQKQRGRNMLKKRTAVVVGTILVFSLAACGGSSNSSNGSSTQGMDMSSSSGSSTSSRSPSQSALSQAFQDELNGFTQVELDIRNGDYKSADTLAGKLHDEFHAVILPPLTAKKGSIYAENIHAKYDDLQTAIQNKDTSKIKQLVKVNTDNLHTVAQILGVTHK